MTKVIVVGSGNAALSAGIAALEKGAEVLMLEKAGPDLAGGNTKYTAGAMRFSYNGKTDLLPLLRNPDDPRLDITDFDGYTSETFENDLLGFNEGEPLTPEQKSLISGSYEAVRWLATHDVKYEPIYSRQSFERDGRHVFWGGLTLAAENEGVGLFDQELAAFSRLGGEIRYNHPVDGLLTTGDRVTGVTVGDQSFDADAVILASGGFEADPEMRQMHIGAHWDKAKVRGTPHNTGDGIKLAQALGAQSYGQFAGCHATPMDLHMANFGNLDLEPKERKNYRKICYFLGIMVNKDGQRFVDEGINFRNYTYAQFGKAIMDQPGHVAWQIFDAKVFDLLYGEYHFHDAHFTQSETLDGLIEALGDINQPELRKTITNFNAAVDQKTPFDPSALDGKGTTGLELAKSNWAQDLSVGPFRAYPVTGGITFTYGGLKVNEAGQIMHENGSAIEGLYGCGELVGGVFLGGYPGGSGLTSGAVFGRRAGYGAATAVR